MKNFMKPIINAIKYWTNSRIEENKTEINERISNSKADWNQNNPEADNYVKNRTHWEEESKVTILEKQTIKGFTLMQESIYCAADAFSMTPIVGQTYTVNWDGVDYEATMKVDDNLALGYIGNKNYINMLSGGDIPFAIIFGEAIFVVTESTVESHVMSISTMKSTVHPLDAKYLPDGIGVQSDWNENDETSKAYVKNRPFYNDTEVLLDRICQPDEYGIEPQLNIQEGEKYRVTIDNIKFENIAYRDEAEGRNTIELIDSNGTYCGYINTWQIYIHNSTKPTYQLRIEHLIPQKIDSKFLPDNIATIADIENAIDGKMNAENPVGTGSFGMNRKSGTTIGSYSVALGYNNEASGKYSHAEGWNTIARGQGAHAEGRGTTASGVDSHAEGQYTTALAACSHAEGWRTIASSEEQHVQGKFNISDADYQYAHIVGNGETDANRSNSHTLDWNGNAWYSGDVYVGSTSGTNRDEGSKKLATEEYSLTLIDIDKITMPSVSNWTSATYGNGKFVVVSCPQPQVLDDTVAYSEDGFIWTEVTIPNSSYRSVAYGDGKFVAVSINSIAAYSEDGVTWTKVTMPNTNWTSITYGSGKFVAVSNYSTKGYSTAAYSRDGINWTEVTVPDLDYTSVVYGNGKFVAVSGYANTDYPIIYSEDGITWTEVAAPKLNYTSIAYGNGKFVATSNYSTAIYSEDGITWTEMAMPFSGGEIVYGGGKFVVVEGVSTAGGEIFSYSAYSEDGITWTQTNIPNNARWSSIVYGNGKFIITSSESNLILYSIDGISWHDSCHEIQHNNKYVTSDIKNLILDGYAEKILDGYATEEYVNNTMAGVDVSGVVRYDESQDLTDEQKTQARENINALGYSWHTIDNNLGIMFASYGSDFIPNWENGLNVESTSTYYENALSEFVGNLYTLMRRTQYFDSFAKNVVNSGFRLIDAGVLLDDTTYFFACVSNNNDVNNPNKIAFVSVKHQSTRSRWQLTDTSAWNVLRTALINDDGTLYQQTLDYTDTSLTKNGLPADAKVTGEALASKITTPTVATVGQTISVKAVDENNKPTEWECTTIEETDPTVPDWAKQPEKPTYTPDEIGAQPAGSYLTEDDLSGYATENFVAAKIAEAELSGGDVDLSGYATKDDIPTKTSQLANDSGFLTQHQDLTDYAKKTDIPDVPVQSVNGKTGAVTLGASDVGALPNTTVIPTVPTKVSAFTNDAGYLTEHQSLAAYAKTADLGDLAAKDTVSKTDLTTDVQASLGKADTALQSYTETDPTVPAWAKAAKKPTYTASEVGADASGTANYAVSEHNASTSAHADIRGRIEQLASDITDLSVFVTPQMFGAKADGITDDSVAIQTAIDVAGNTSVVYLSKGTYNISKSLVFSHRPSLFRCDGTIFYTGTGAAIIVARSETNLEISCIEAPNGTAIQMNSGNHGLSCGTHSVSLCSVKIGQIVNCKIGLHEFTDNQPQTYNKFIIDRIAATEICVFVENLGTDSQTIYINEHKYWFQKLTGAKTGIKIVKGGAHRFFSGSFEGLQDDGVALHLITSNDIKVRGFRCAENYGKKSVVFEGKCSYNDLEFSVFNLTEEIDISNLAQGSTKNILRSPWIAITSHRLSYAEISYEFGILYDSTLVDTAVNVTANSFSSNVIKQVDYRIPTILTFDSSIADGTAFKLASFFSSQGSIVRGNPITLAFPETGALLVLKDATDSIVLDNREGKYSGKTVTVRWIGYYSEKNDNTWLIQVHGRSTDDISFEMVNQDITFASNSVGLVMKNSIGDKYRLITKDNGLITTIPLSDIDRIYTSIDTDGSVYNGCGYIDGYRINSSGNIAASTWSSASGFIPVVAGDVLRLVGFTQFSNTNDALAVYDANFNCLGTFTGIGQEYGIFAGSAFGYSAFVNTDGVFSWNVPSGRNIAYVRVSTQMYNTQGLFPSANMRVYIDGVSNATEIVESVNGKRGNVQLTAESIGAPTIEQFNQLSEEIVDYPKFITPQMYGAKGDGTTDDTEAFENALAENDDVYVPSGNYLISRGLNLTYKKSLFSNDGQRATLLFNGSGSIVNLGRLSVFRNINIRVKNAFVGTVFNTHNHLVDSGQSALESRVEDVNVFFEVASPDATLIGITVDSGTDPDNMPRLKGVCYQTYHDICVEYGSNTYGYGIRMELIENRQFTEETKTGFPWITHIDYDDVFLGSPHTAIKAGVVTADGVEHFERVDMGHLLFNNVSTQYRNAESTKIFFDLNHFSGFFTKCIGWDYHPLTWAGEKVNIIGKDVRICLTDSQMAFGADFMKCCDFTAETEFTVDDHPEYFINKYFPGTVLSQGYDSIDAKITAKLTGEYVANIAEERINDILYSGYANVLDDPLTQIKVRQRWSSSSNAWIEGATGSTKKTTVIIPIAKGGNVIRWTPSTHTSDGSYDSIYFFNDDGLTDGISAGKLFLNSIITDGYTNRVDIDNPNGYKYVALPFTDYADISAETMTMTINREITGNEGKSYTEYLKESVIDPAVSVKVSEEIGKLDIPTKTSQLENDSGFLTQHQSLEAYAKKTELPTKTSQLTNDSGFITAKDIPEAQVPDLSGYALKSSAETWTFTLADGSTVTKKVVLA